jgi:hypothetical protein
MYIPDLERHNLDDDWSLVGRMVRRVHLRVAYGYESTGTAIIYSVSIQFRWSEGANNTNIKE